MLRLAKSSKFLLVKIGREYWYILSDFEIGCLEEQSESYNALNALSYMESILGPAEWVRDHFKSY